jgi:hypothetical protein
MTEPRAQHFIDALERQRNEALNAAANAQALVAAQAEIIEGLTNENEGLQARIVESGIGHPPAPSG